MCNMVPTNVYDLLKTVVDGNIEDYNVSSVEGPNKKGDGFLSEFCFVSLKKKCSEEEFHFAIKQAFDDDRRNVSPIRKYFLNELHFYTKVFPDFLKFQREFGIKEPLDKVPKCFATNSEAGKEKIILENLKYQGFVVHNKRQTFSNVQVELIMKQFGKFHGISFAYKLLKPKEYIEISQGLQNSLIEMYRVRSFSHYIQLVHDTCLSNLDQEEDADVVEKYKPYVENGVNIFAQLSTYKGNYSAILHGDCSSNNMLFKYNDTKELSDLRLIDFQQSYVSTPVSDLSYCIYSSSSKDILDNLECYLKIYHDNLLVTIQEFGCDSRDVYPFEQLKKDWKVYCKVGFTMGLCQWRLKMTHESDILDLTDVAEAAKTPEKKLASQGRYDKGTFRTRARELIWHMYENDFL